MIASSAGTLPRIVWSCAATLLWCASAAAQSAAAPQTTPPITQRIDRTVLEDLVLANRILSDEGVLDGFGHVSVRNPKDPTHFLMSRSLAPALVTVGDIIELDLDGNTKDQGSPALERFIHTEIYRARPDVMAIVHSHSPSVIPFGATKVELKPIYHNGAFLGAGVPVFEIRTVAGMSDMLIRTKAIGEALAKTLGDKAVVLIRGHGDAVTGPSLPDAVFRAIYTDMNARLQMQAMAMGAPVTYLAPEEAVLADKPNVSSVSNKVWDLWKRKVMGSPK
jgi:ribulose-5-phosphate 4-epimerase/fuculose-1-phosphate aldolase